jgi:hypothetical protein
VEDHKIYNNYRYPATGLVRGFRLPKGRIRRVIGTIGKQDMGVMAGMRKISAETTATMAPKSGFLAPQWFQQYTSAKGPARSKRMFPAFFIAFSWSPGRLRPCVHW